MSSYSINSSKNKQRVRIYKKLNGYELANNWETDMNDNLKKPTDIVAEIGKLTRNTNLVLTDTRNFCPYWN